MMKIMQDQDMTKTLIGELASQISPYEHGGVFKQRLGMRVAS
jgi:hypothetical protein